MKKTTYVAKTLLLSLSGRLCLTWILVLLISFGLTMTIGIAWNTIHIQSYYINADMSGLAYYVDSVTDYFSDATGRADSTKKRREKLEESLPGLKAVYEQTMLYCKNLNMSVFGYPSELLDRLYLPTSEKGVSATSSALAITNPVWLDYRLIGQYAQGDRITLSVSGERGEIRAFDFTVAGFLNSENVHYDFQSGASSDSFSADIVSLNPDGLVCVTMSDGLFDSAEYDADRSVAKFLLPENSEDIAAWKELARAKGFGQISDMNDILENDAEAIDLETTPIITLCIVMILLTVIGLIGTQMQMMNLHRQIAFSLILCGMEWSIWRRAWFLILLVPLGIVSILGGMLGTLWKSIIILESPSLFSGVIVLICVGVLGLSALGILPTIHRWSNAQAIEIRRLSE